MRYIKSTDELKDIKDGVLFFYSTELEPAVAKCAFMMAKKISEHLEVIGINYQDFPATKERYNIKGLPTLIWIKNGAQNKSILGLLSQNEVDNMIKETRNGS